MMPLNIPGRPGGSGGGEQKVAALDEKLREIVPEYYFALKELGDRDKAIKLLARHVAIMVEMINDFKGVK